VGLYILARRSTRPWYALMVCWGVLGCNESQAPTPIAAVALSPRRLTLEVPLDGPLLQASISIVNGAEGTVEDLRATVHYDSTASNWLQVSFSTSTATRTAGATLFATVFPAGLAAGSHTATIFLTSSNAANTPYQIPVSLTVTAPAPTRGTLMRDTL
jgi:hypothetical protein